MHTRHYEITVCGRLSATLIGAFDTELSLVLALIAAALLPARATARERLPELAKLTTEGVLSGA